MHLLQRLVLLCGLVVAASAASQPQVELDYATYIGTPLVAGVNQFLGMRFAAPPIGSLRWRAPADPLPEQAPVEAFTHGPLCYNVGGTFDPTSTSLSEDCLFIDVYAPSSNVSSSSQQAGKRNNKLLPVWFFIQGGGYRSDSNANYNGTGVIVESGHNIVVVNFNYRVGGFGFLASERVARDGTLNVGLLDQRKALLWVKKYISKFGGDPNHVVIHGASAGGGSVTHHLTAYGGRNDRLFVAAIGESVFWPWEPPVAEPEFQFDLFADAAGCPGTKDSGSQMACLRLQNTSTLVSANQLHPFPGRMSNPDFYWTPTIDGDFVRGELYDMFSEGKFIRVPLLIGDASDEGTNFAFNASTPSQVTSFMQDNYPRLTSSDLLRISRLYPLMPPLPAHAAYFPSAALAYGEGTFTCPSNFIAARMSHGGSEGEKGIDVWNYRFSVVQADREAAGFGVSHTSEIPAIFGPAFVPGGLSTTFATTNAPIVPVVMNFRPVWPDFGGTTRIVTRSSHYHVTACYRESGDFRRPNDAGSGDVTLPLTTIQDVSNRSLLR
ncbi:triacylglycerol lipase-like protein [Favolaschia claudopus]|uniref:Carboxylic ester hydrolase n=1 Tax=Favolaschia claudopus TaxID=2862362 RepID=A0AAW0AY71_9AGAR